MNEKVIAIIPARSGSKSVKDKNIRLLNGRPLIAYSIEQAVAARSVERVIVSTDSEEYAKIAREYGADVPFIRPAEYSNDTSLDIDVFRHALIWLQENEGFNPEICVHLRPTHPIRDVDDIDKMVNILETNKSLDSVRSVSLAKQTPYKMWLFSDDSKTLMSPVVTCDICEAYNAPRQILPVAYMQNACIDVVRSSVIMEQNSMTGQKIGGYKMTYDYDIDTESDFLTAERALVMIKAKQMGKAIKICCDIDGIIAGKTRNNNYDEAEALKRNIEIINALHDVGCIITLFTARGYVTGIDWSSTTRKQLEKWGVKYDELKFGKPDADFYVDDKMIDLWELTKLKNNE